MQNFTVCHAIMMIVEFYCYFIKMGHMFHIVKIITS